MEKNYDPMKICGIVMMVYGVLYALLGMMAIIGMVQGLMPGHEAGEIAIVALSYVIADPGDRLRLCLPASLQRYGDEAGAGVCAAGDRVAGLYAGEHGIVQRDRFYFDGDRCDDLLLRAQGQAGKRTV